MIKYKNYLGTVEFDDEANIFHGEVVNIRDVITFEGTNVRELRKAFKDSIEDYLAFCKERGEEPEKPFSGNLVLRLTPRQHRQIYLLAKQAGKSLNAWISERLDQAAGL